MTDELDVLALSEEVDQDSKSGVLSKVLLSHGNTLYGVDTRYPGCIIRTTPDGENVKGRWKNGMFVADINLSLSSN
ncbi:MAG: hypothetical protein KKE08_19560 [Gammaproteobacteria bacterium]|nr:hypothetical protein [Gammaproteobacteria bacterium]MBU2185227.1 hypothetical protein [Gammaproteobacteria bacterium]MBU2206286.1 hypothetical protein [Gammaproteobacteria bacterium]